VRTATNDAGVDHVLEVGGKDTLPKAFASLAFGGHIAIIGLLSGFPTEVPAGMLMQRGASISGIYVGSRADFEAMNAFISAHKIKPVVDKVFSFEDTDKAFKYMDEGKLFGKVVIKM
jgi:NADPH:quinone reductase-like Zn-dependent oxidoreductase